MSLNVVERILYAVFQQLGTVPDVEKQVLDRWKHVPLSILLEDGAAHAAPPSEKTL